MRVDANAHTHGRRHRHFAQVDALAGGRLGLVERIDQRRQVALELVGVERAAADGGVDLISVNFFSLTNYFLIKPNYSLIYRK